MDIKKLYAVIKPYLLSKRTWIVVAAVAADFSGVLPDKILHELTAVSIIATKVIDTIQSGGQS